MKRGIPVVVLQVKIDAVGSQRENASQILAQSVHV